jgi:hypothetical protein
LDEIKKNSRTSLLISFRPRTRTAKVAQSIIGRLKLKGQRRGPAVVYTNPKYPNVRVIATSLSHPGHPRHLAKALALDENAKAGKLQSGMA